MDTTTASGNFLVPNATFIAELVGFLIVLAVLGKYVLPLLNDAVTERQQLIRHQYEESEQARADARAAEAEFRSQLVEARHEASRIREEAKEQGASIIAEMREQAQSDASRIIEHAQAQLEAERALVVQQLRNELGRMATTLAGTIVGESLEDDERRARTVDRFIASLESESSDQPSGVG